MRVLVTGATGLVGRAVLDHLLARAAAVTMATSTPGVVPRAPRLSVVPFRLDDPVLAPETERALAGCDAVVHAAAVIPSPADLMDRTAGLAVYRRNLAGTTVLMEAAAAASVRSFVYISALNLFPPSAGLVTEETLPAPPNLYVQSKLCGEGVAAQLDRLGPTRFASLRISAPYGPFYRIRAVIPTFVENALAGRPLRLAGTGERRQLFTCAEDVAVACRLCIERTASGVFNIAGARPVSMRELAETVLAVAPDRGSRIKVSGSPDPDGGRHRRASLERARVELGFVPAFDIADGLRAMIAAIEKPSPPPFAVPGEAP